MVDFIESIIENAQKLGALSAAAVWAFFTLLLIAYFIYQLKIQRESSRDAWEARKSEAKADLLIAGAVEKTNERFMDLEKKIEDLERKIDRILEELFRMR